MRLRVVPLYVFLRQREPIGEQVSAFFKRKAYEYLETPAGWSRYSVGDCDRLVGDERKSCFDRAMGGPRWRSYHSYLVRGLPRSKVYENILLFTGGPEARRMEPGWASWRQVWPAVSVGTRDRGDGFDVSDVDVTNFPVLDCDQEYPGLSNAVRSSCWVSTVFLPGSRACWVAEAQ